MVEAAKPLTGALQTGLFPAELDLNATITVTNTAGEVHAMTTTNHFFAHLVAYPCWVADPTQVLCP